MLGAGVASGAAAQPRRRVRIQIAPLAGFQYQAGEEVWLQLATDQPLSLVREPDNPFDADAMRIDWRGHKQGYLPRAQNTALAQMLDRGEQLRARIARLKFSADPWQRVRVAVELAV